MTSDIEEQGYPEPAKLEMVWGEGFMSPGGADEVSRIVAGHDLTGLAVLDFGCGLGGADAVLVERHGAASVIGLDIQPLLVERATARAKGLGLDRRVTYVLGVPGRIPFADASFDAVFTKDAIIHIADKAAVLREIARVLRPGGLLLLGDWLTGGDPAHAGLADRFLSATGHDFHLATPDAMAKAARDAGFTSIESEDRWGWYEGEATAERDRLLGEMGRRFEANFGAKAFEDERAFYDILVEAVAKGVVQPGHLRASKG